MGENAGIAAILRDVIRPRAAYVAAAAGEPPGRRGALPRRARAADGPDVGRPGLVPAVPGRRRPPPARSRSATSTGSTSSGFTAWLPPSAIAEGVYYGIRVGGRLVSAAGTHVVSPEARLGVVGQRDDPRRLPRPRLRHRRHRRGHRRAAPVLRPGRAQRPRRQPAGAAGLPQARLPRARALRGAARPPRACRRQRWRRGARGPDSTAPRPRSRPLGHNRQTRRPPARRTSRRDRPP